VNFMLHFIMSFSAILLWSSPVVLLSAVDICRDSFALLVCLGLLFHSLLWFSVGVICHRACASLFYLILMYRSFTLFSAVVLCRDSLILFSNLCRRCFASFLVGTEALTEIRGHQSWSDLM
jgi:hypothetical protein